MCGEWIDIVGGILSLALDCIAFPAGASVFGLCFAIDDPPPMAMAESACSFVCAFETGDINIAAAACGSSAADMPAVAGNDGVFGLYSCIWVSYSNT